MIMMVEFVNPVFLWGLIALIIPIIIHLFNFKRYKKVYFSNVRLLKELQSETNKQSQLRRWLLFLSRLFVIVCIVLAFSQPVIPVDNSLVNIERPNSVSIYIDNSFSMNNMNGKLDLILVKDLCNARRYHFTEGWFKL